MYDLARRNDDTSTIVDVGGVRFGDGFAVIAGPCAIEDAFQIECVAKAVRAYGAAMLRGGAFKPRTSPAAAGLDGAMVEVHPDPARSRSDAEQPLTSRVSRDSWTVCAPNLRLRSLPRNADDEPEGPRLW